MYQRIMKQDKEPLLPITMGQDGTAIEDMRIASDGEVKEEQDAEKLFFALFLKPVCCLQCISPMISFILEIRICDQGVEMNRSHSDAAWTNLQTEAPVLFLVQVSRHPSVTSCTIERY